MRLKFTDLALRNFPHPESGQVKLRDTTTPGLGCVVGTRTKTFFIMTGKSRRTRTIGRFPEISLREARRDASRLLGRDLPKKKLTSYPEACESFLNHCRELNLAQGTIDNYKFSLAAVDATTVENIPLDVTYPNYVKALKVFLNWCLDQEIIEKNPYARRKVKYNQRDRVLTDEELKLVWHYDWPPYSDYLKLCILTGQRRNQWRNFSIAGNLFHFPDMKGGKPHVLPALPMAIEVAQRLKPFNGWSKAKARLDKHVPLPKWVVHDLRRTHSTAQARIGTPIHVTEKILDHSSGTISGVAAIYNRHHYLDEARVALANYEDWLQSVIS